MAAKQQATPAAPTGPQGLAKALLAAFAKLLAAAPANCPLSGQGGNAAPCSALPALHTALQAGHPGTGARGLAVQVAAHLLALTQGTCAAAFKAGKGITAMQGAVAFWAAPLRQAVHGYVVAGPGTAYTCPCGKYTYPVGVTRVVCCANGHKPTVHPSLWAAGQVQYGPHLLPAHLQAAAAKALASGAPAAGGTKCNTNVHGGAPVYATAPAPAKAAKAG